MSAANTTATASGSAVGVEKEEEKSGHESQNQMVVVESENKMGASAAAATESETIKSAPSLTKSGKFTEDLSDVVESDREEATALTKVVATFISDKSHGHTFSKEEVTRKFQKKVTQLKKEVGHAFSDLRLIFRILLFLASFGTLILAFIRFATLSTKLANEYGDIPTCVFQWSEWTECSAPCSTPNQTATRKRYVIPESVIDMSNIQKDSSNIKIWLNVYISLHRSTCYDIKQTTYCNLYECPVNLSTLTNFSKCQYSIVSSDPDKQQCVQYRELPPRGLVTIDQELEMYRICNCNETNYPF